jgi:molecular chaperone GrpE
VPKDVMGNMAMPAGRIDVLEKGTRDDDVTGPGQASELEASAARLERLLEQEQQRMVQLRADLANVRRRARIEQDAAGRAGRRSALLPLLPVLDALERALAAGSSDVAFYDGVSQTRRLLVAALLEAGAEPIAAEGEAFDPRRHEAVATVRPLDEAERGRVLREVRRGWSLGDELLRPAQVVVAEGRTEPWAPEPGFVPARGPA